MQQYIELLEKVLRHGEIRTSRAGNTLGLFGEVLTFNDTDNFFPAITVKKLYFNSVASELAGFLRAETNATKMGSSIWEADAKRWSKGSYMGRIYGVQWRQWSARNGLIDQLREIVDRIKTDPTDRRLLVTAWNPGELDQMCLPPCHYAFQFHVEADEYLNCMFHMRSVDLILGLPFDIASYALLLAIVANETHLKPGRVVATLGDTHIYQNHIYVANQLIHRAPHALCKLQLDADASIDNFVPEMATLISYRHHPAVKAKLNVG